MTSFPSILPLPRKSEYSLKRKSGVKKTQMESGIPRLRQITRNAPTEIDVVWHFSESEFAIFEGWYLFEAREGASWFDIQLKGSLGLSFHKARFVGDGYSYKIDVNTNKWVVNVTLQVLEAPRLSHGGYQLLMNYGFEDVIYSANFIENETNKFFNNI